MSEDELPQDKPIGPFILWLDYGAYGGWAFRNVHNLEDALAWVSSMSPSRWILTEGSLAIEARRRDSP